MEKNMVSAVNSTTVGSIFPVGNVDSNNASGSTLQIDSNVLNDMLRDVASIIEAAESAERGGRKGASQAAWQTMPEAGLVPTSPATGGVAWPTSTSEQSAAGSASAANLGNAGTPNGSDASTVLSGNATTLASPDAKCPPGVSMSQMMSADGGLLKKLGNQTLKGAGAAGITGGIADNLSKKSGGSRASDIGTDPNVTWRALQNLQAFKNTPGSDGKAIPVSVRHNGNVSGLQPSGEVARGSTLGELQDWFKGAISGPQGKLPTGNKVNSQGVETSGAQQAGGKILKGLSDVADVGQKVVDATVGKIPGIGKIFSAPVDIISGGISGGLDAASQAASGNDNAAKQLAKQTGGDLLTTISQSSGQLSSVMQKAGEFIPEFKPFALAGSVLAQGVSGAANIGSSALDGGNVNASVDEMAEGVGKQALSATASI